LILPGVDPQQDLALPDELTIRHIKRNDISRDPRRNDHRPAVGIGVVGRFDIAALVPEVQSARRQGQDQAEPHRLEPRGAPISRLVAGIGRRRLRGLRIRHPDNSDPLAVST
jgi:hypothetical protein